MENSGKHVDCKFTTWLNIAITWELEKIQVPESSNRNMNLTGLGWGLGIKFFLCSLEDLICNKVWVTDIEYPPRGEKTGVFIHQGFIHLGLTMVPWPQKKRRLRSLEQKKQTNKKPPKLNSQMFIICNLGCMKVKLNRVLTVKIVWILARISQCY